MKSRIVIADNHTVLRVGLKSFLSDNQHESFDIVGEAENGKEAIKLVEKLSPDLLLLDLSMPVMGGLETTLELRRKENTVKILILTQYDESIYLKRLLESGANGYILKSAKGEELISAIQSILQGGTYIDPTLAGSLVTNLHHQQNMKGKKSDEEKFELLTPREKQILKYLADGLANKEIASELNLSIKTVMAHRANLTEKLGIKNHSKLVQFAIKMGLIPVPR